MMTTTGETPDFDLLTPLDTDADVLDRVDQIIGEDARRDRALWLLFLDADAVQLPVVVPIDDIPANPDPDCARSICDMSAHVLNDAAPGGSAVITLVRDHRQGMPDSDQQWLMAFQAAAARTGVRLRMFCVATRDGVRRLEPWPTA
jgi:hypothetical protein